LPNLSWIAQAFIDILLPVFGMMIFHFVYGKESKNQKIHAEEDANPMGWIAVTVISVLIIWFAVGVFPIRPYVILTGSMEPVIKPGDIVLVQRYDPNETLQVGDIIQYRSGEIFVFHRLIEIFEEDKVTKYRMKGDNNPTEDPAPVETKDLRGRVIKIIPKIGYPALFLKSVIRR
jgi:signal peptidase